jgi:hemerythrin superfamily protein
MGAFFTFLNTLWLRESLKEEMKLLTKKIEEYNPTKGSKVTNISHRMYSKKSY